MLTATIAIASIAQIILSLFVFFRSRSNLSYKLFFFIGISTLGWALADYLSAIYINSPNAIYTVRAVLFFVVLQNAFFYMFARAFPSSSWRYSKKWLAIYWLSALAVAIATLSPYMFKSLEVKDNIAVTKVGPLILLFILQIIFSVVVIFGELISKMRASKGAARQQLQILLFASFLLWIIVPITNFGITQLTGTTVFTKFAPVYTVIFTSIIAYAIIRHKLFDIKRAVVRSVAYLLSLGFVGLIYGSIIFGASSLISSDPKFDNAERIFYVFLALLSAILFGPTKRFFDRVTNRIFYRDAYDPQQFLDVLNTTVVENIELGILIRHATAVIQDNLKSQFCFIEIKSTATSAERLIGTGEFSLSVDDNTVLKEELHKTGKRVILTDELGSEFNRLKEVLSKNSIGMLVRLLPGSDMNKESMYYLILGDKKSGNIYDEQDIRIIDIIADELLIAIQNSIRFEEIQQFNVTLQQRVNDATVKLQRTNKKLRDLDETKDEFISMASHQLRTPLTSVKGYMSMVIEGDAGKLNKQQEALLNQAFVSSQRMVYLIADLLNVSRLKTGKFVIDAQATNLAEVVDGEISQLVETAKGKKLELVYEKPKKFTELMLDETKVRQVVMNFIDNAVYYTPSGGHIKAEVKEDEGHVYFTVKDDGLGVPKDDQKHLFTKFFRAVNARNARPDGTGLGLFMAKKVVDAQGGNILFESNEGKGSLFGFSFDKRKLAVPETEKTE